MATYERFTDRKDRQRIIDGKKEEFRKRKHGLPPTRVIYYFMAVPVLVSLIVIYTGFEPLSMVDSVYSTAEEYTTVGETVELLIIIALLIAVTAMIASVLIKKIHNIITETEYLNLVFASSMGAYSDFWMVVDEKDSSVYYDSIFAEYFSPAKGAHKENFDVFIEHEGLTDDDRKTIKEAISKKTSANVPFTYTGSSGSTKNMIVSVRPLVRPEGYCVIRGYSEE